jgi:hypothetical protein
MAWVARFGIYIGALLAGIIAMAGYGSFDPETWIFDLHPFNVRDAVLTLTAMVGNGLAAVAAWRGWRGKGEKANAGTSVE